MPSTLLSRADFEDDMNELRALAWLRVVRQSARRNNSADKIRRTLEIGLRPRSPCAVAAPRPRCGFANAYRQLHQRIGPNYERRVALRARLGLDEYQHQRMMAIAAQSKTLTQFSRALPPAVEPLYELARLTKNAAGEKRLRRAVERKELTPTSGIREIRNIRQSTRPAATKGRASKAAVELRAPSSLEFTIDAEEGLTLEQIDEFKTELVALVEKYGLHLRTRNETPQRRAKHQPAADGGVDERARLDRIFSTPVLNRVISEEDFAATPNERRAEYTRELLECYERYKAVWDAGQKKESESVEGFFERKFNDTAGEEMRAFSREVLEIGAKYGVPRAIAALKGEMSPEVKKWTKVAKAMLGKDRGGRDE
jgi:hypothetical protein